ncbi:hypothetical protein EXW72_04195 [Pseudomonas sp. BCA14]|nr:hypothetical protein EXW70_08290 [Pseudomonas sp. JMN1]TFF14825.1 hypothetical protein EXW71_00750 [Pseudomonas sp. BCA17]TFF31231.1 hypothetical protein EXW72_04195 [Pseudomonas sp. BCA14]
MARELAPVGPRSGPALCLHSMGLLRSPTGASSLATGYFLAFSFLTDWQYAWRGCFIVISL